jgi:phage head maturation protease
MGGNAGSLNSNVDIGLEIHSVVTTTSTTTARALALKTGDCDESRVGFCARAGARKQKNKTVEKRLEQRRSNASLLEGHSGNAKPSIVDD